MRFRSASWASTGPAGEWKSLDQDAGSVDFATGASSGDHFSSAPGAGEGGWKQT